MPVQTAFWWKSYFEVSRVFTKVYNPFSLKTQMTKSLFHAGIIIEELHFSNLICKTAFINQYFYRLSFYYFLKWLSSARLSMFFNAVIWNSCLSCRMNTGKAGVTITHYVGIINGKGWWKSQGLRLFFQYSPSENAQEWLIGESR